MELGPKNAVFFYKKKKNIWFQSLTEPINIFYQKNIYMECYALVKVHLHFNCRNKKYPNVVPLLVREVEWVELKDCALSLSSEESLIFWPRNGIFCSEMLEGHRKYWRNTLTEPPLSIFDKPFLYIHTFYSTGGSQSCWETTQYKCILRHLYYTRANRMVNYICKNYQVFGNIPKLFPKSLLWLQILVYLSNKFIQIMNKFMC